jgi:hypothetical protein
MASWSDLEKDARDLAAVGRRLFKADSVAIGFLATIARNGSPRISPVCPIFAGDHVYVSVGAHTPKKEDLSRDGRFSLHAFLGPEDEELQVSGRAVEVTDPTQRSFVHGAIRFGAFSRDDPVFRLDLQRCVHVRWERVGRPDTRSIRRSWSTASGRVREVRWSLAGSSE